MSENSEPVHARMAELAGPYARRWAVDLGSGRGPTLRALGQVRPAVGLIGADRSLDSLQEIRTTLSDHVGPVAPVEADLRDTLPFADASVDVVLSYNTLECLNDLDLAGLMGEVERVLRPGGGAVLAHVDFDSLVVAGVEQGLDRRVCHAFADDQQGWMDHSDGRMGRKLPGLVADGPLSLVHVEPLLVWSTELAGHARDRVEDIRRALLSAVRHGRTSLTVAEVEAWFAALCEADRRGGFFVSETTFIVVAERAAPH